MTPVFKKGIKSDPNNCRPISVIPIISKGFETIVYNQLCHYLDDNKLLPGCQSGFRSLHSTLTALLETTNAWSVNIDNGLLNGLVFVDLIKAFDTIDHVIILRKILGFRSGSYKVHNRSNSSPCFNQYSFASASFLKGTHLAMGPRWPGHYLCPFLNPKSNVSVGYI